MALAALDANGGNVCRTARQLGLPDSTLEGWAKGRGISPAVHALREVKKGTLAEKFDEVAHMALDLTLDDLEGLRKAGPQARIIVAGIATEKKLLLTGQPTQITEQREEAKAVVRTVFEELCERARAEGRILTRAQVAARLVELRPELRDMFADELGGP